MHWQRPRYELDLPPSPTGQVPRQVGPFDRSPRPPAADSFLPPLPTRSTPAATELVPKWEVLDIKRLDQGQTVADLEGWARMRFPRTRFELAGGDVESLRETLGHFDRLGRMYRQVEESTPLLTVLPAEQFPGLPTAFAATGPDGTIKLNLWWFGEGQRSWFDNRWVLDRVSGDLALPPREAVLGHEFGEAYRVWLERERPALWREASAFVQANHPVQGLGKDAERGPNEGFAEAFTVMHLTPPRQWPAYVRSLRNMLRHEIRVPYAPE